MYNNIYINYFRSENIFKYKNHTVT